MPEAATPHQLRARQRAALAPGTELAGGRVASGVRCYRSGLAVAQELNAKCETPKREKRSHEMPSGSGFFVFSFFVRLALTCCLERIHAPLYRSPGLGQRPDPPAPQGRGTPEISPPQRQAQ